MVLPRGWLSKLGTGLRPCHRLSKRLVQAGKKCQEHQADESRAPGPVSNLPHIELGGQHPLPFSASLSMESRGTSFFRERLKEAD